MARFTELMLLAILLLGVQGNRRGFQSDAPASASDPWRRTVDPCVRSIFGLGRNMTLLLCQPAAKPRTSMETLFGFTDRAASSA
jgi:hypothetical protein